MTVAAAHDEARRYNSTRTALEESPRQVYVATGPSLPEVQAVLTLLKPPLS